MKNIDNAVQALFLMEKQLNDLIKDDKKKWGNTYIFKQIEKRKCGGTFTLQDHIRGMVYSLLSSGVKWERLEPSIDIETGQNILLDEIFLQYDVEMLKNTSPKIWLKEIEKGGIKTPYTVRQLEIILVNILKMQSIDKEYGNIDNFYNNYNSKDDTKKLLLKVLSVENSKYKYGQMDIALNAEYLRNVGYDIAKPDRHICRILSENYLDCSEYGDIHKNEISRKYEAIDIVAKIGTQAGKSISETDYIFWSFCADRFGEICTACKPKCNICSLKKFCKSKGKIL